MKYIWCIKFFVFIFAHVDASNSDSCQSYGISSANLREVIIGKCTFFQENINHDVFCEEGFRNCTQIWESFKNSFVHQPTCNVSLDKMTEYISLTNHSIPPNKNMFWENVYPFVSRFTNQGQRYVSVSDTLTGYIGDAVQWCSDDNSTTGMTSSGQTCPGFETTPDCYQSAQRAFWIAVSKHFAQSASGEVFILLNSSVTPIFSLDTYFAVYELPHIANNLVTKATVLLITENPEESGSKCEDSSLTKLSQKLKEKQIQYFCIENRRDVVMTFCLDNPEAKVCDMLLDTTSGAEIVNMSNVNMFIAWVGLVIFKLLSKTD
ncbi:ADP-ribosyl cyclase [Mactra antiquata]